MNKVLVTLLSILFFQFASAQNTKDSLLTLLKKHPQLDTVRCNLLNALIEAEGDDAIWPKYNAEMQAIALKNCEFYKSTNTGLYVYYLKIICVSYNNEGYRFLQLGQNNKAIGIINEGIKLATKHNLKNELALLYNNVADFYYNANDYNKMLFYTLKAYNLFLELKDESSQVSMLSNLGVCYSQLNNNAKYIECLQKSIKLAKKINKYELAASTLYNLGEYYSQIYNLKDASECFLDALAQAEKTNDLTSVTFCYDALASAYTKNNDFEKAEFYALKALNLGIQIKDIKRIAHNNVVLGNIQFNKILQIKKKVNNAVTDSLEFLARNYFLNANKLYNTFNFESGKSYAFTKYADFLYAFSKKKVGNKIEIIDSLHQKSFYYYSEALKIDEKIGNKQFVAENLSNLSYILLDKNNYQQALPLALRSLHISENMNYPKNILNSAKSLLRIYKVTGDTKKALEMSELCNKMNDTIYNTENKTQILKAEYNYETQKKEASIKQLEQQNQITSLQSKQKSIILYSIIGLVIAIALLSYFLFTRYKTKKQNELLKTKLEDAELLLIEKQKASDSEIKAIKSQMNPHFFYNALNSIQGYIYSGDKENAAKSLGLFSDLSRSVLESSRNTEISLHDEIELLENYLKLETMRLPKIKYSIQVPENINIHDLYIPAMILQPLVENAIKHGLANKQGEGLLTVNFIENKNKLFINIEDDGIGRDAAAEIGKRMMKKSASFSTEANMSRIELLNANKTEKITQEIIDKKDSDGNATGTIVKLVIPIELYD